MCWLRSAVQSSRLPPGKAPTSPLFDSRITLKYSDELDERKGICVSRGQLDTDFAGRPACMLCACQLSAEPRAPLTVLVGRSPDPGGGRRPRGLHISPGLLQGAPSVEAPCGGQFPTLASLSLLRKVMARTRERGWEARLRPARSAHADPGTSSWAGVTLTSHPTLALPEERPGGGPASCF